ncbi:MAG: transposase [Gammaproteobacteria bacterium]
MLRIHIVQKWFDDSDSGIKEALHDVLVLRRFAGLDATVDKVPDMDMTNQLLHEQEETVREVKVHTMNERNLSANGWKEGPVWCFP